MYLVGYGLVFGTLILATMHGAQWIVRWLDGPAALLDST